MAEQKKIPVFTIEDKLRGDIYEIKFEKSSLYCVQCNGNVCNHIMKFIHNIPLMKEVRKYVSVSPSLIKSIEKQFEEEKARKRPI